MVDIVIPIYKPIPSEDDLKSIQQVFTILGEYEITFVHPKELDVEQYQQRYTAKFKGFDSRFFKGIYGYNQFMMSKEFYLSFQKKYILIYQTDAFVFKNSLKYWMDKDYDYIGAPWLRSKQNIPFFKKIWDFGICLIKQSTNYKGNQKTQKNKSLLYNEVGNGGLSLRKRTKFLEILEQLEDVVNIYLSPKNQSSFYAEDVFYSIEPERNKIPFNKPNYKEACSFAIENKPEKALEITQQELPFGCHRWNKESRNFWKKHFATFGVEI